MAPSDRGRLALSCQRLRLSGGKSSVRAFLFERDGSRWVFYWDGAGESKLTLPVASGKVELFDEFAGKSVAFEQGASSVTIPAGSRLYLKTSLSAEEIRAAFAAARGVLKN